MTQEVTQQSPTHEPSQAGAAVAVTAIHFEHLRDPLGIGTSRPRLSWLVETGRPNWRQIACELEAAGPDGQTRGQTGRIDSDQSALVAWPFAPLASRERLSIRVRVWGSDGSESAWSSPYTVEAGLLRPDDWSARFITPQWEESASARPAPLLRREFSVKAGVAEARLYITALGVYEAQINGLTVGDHVLDPGWTSYNHRLRYQTFDVTHLVREGPNAIGAMLSDGWYRGRLTWNPDHHQLYGDRLALLSQLEIRYLDGTTDRIVTDEQWRAASGPILSSGIYDGETYDARLERAGWSLPGGDHHDWVGVELIERDLGTLFAPLGPPVRRTALLAPVTIGSSPSGRTIVDFGQNLVGKLRITVKGPAGTVVTLRHAEVLDQGELGVRPLRSAEATDHYILRGDEEPETWEPRFTFHGFRYAEVAGWPGELRPDDIGAVVCHSDMERIGWFECSDPLLNRLHENVVWSMRGNFLDLPTDCPQRDERLGWTGDINVFAPTASFLYDASGFLSSWLADLAVEQKEAKDVVSFVVPNVLPEEPVPTAVWGDAAVVVPWTLYERYGDVGILDAQFDSMKSWVDLIAGLAGEDRLWDRGFQFGDWLDPSAPPDRPAEARTDPFLLATACFARSAELVGYAAGVLGRSDDEAHYHALAAEVRKAFANEYSTPSGRLLSDATTAYALAIQFGLLPAPEQRRHAGVTLAELVRASGYHISTGFVGTPLICDALCSAGQYDAAYRLLMQRDCPSWLYAVTMDATTIWERWDSLLPDGSINPGEMTSYNHYAFGAVADWLHRTVGGLAPAEPGYRRIEFCPRPGGGLTYAHVSHRTPYGMAECAWRTEAGKIDVQVVVPPNSTGAVSLPRSDMEPIEVGSGSHHWSYPYQVPEPVRVPLSIANTLGEIIDDPEAWAVTLVAIRAQMPEYTGGDISPKGSVNLPVRQVFEHHPNGSELLAAIARALAGLNRKTRDGSASQE